MKLPVAVVALVALGALLLPAQASASCVWREQQGICRDSFTGARYYCTRNTCVYPRTYYSRSRDYDRERRYYDRDDRRGYRSPPARESTRRVSEGCKWNDRLRVTGTDKLDKDRAEVSAQDAWSSAVEVRYGTLYSDIANAEDLVVTCVRKVPSSIVERAQAAGGLRHHVCELSAVPCAPEAEEKDEKSRAKRLLERRSESPVSDQPARP